METEPTNPQAPSSSGGEPMRKYVRTFASDMAIAKKGGTPDLTPRDAPEPPKKQPAPAPVEAPPVVEPVAETPPEPPAEPTASPLKTYANDFVERVKDTHASTATVLAAEGDARTEAPTPEEAPASRWGSVFAIVGGVVLLVLGGWGLYVGYLHYLVNTKPVTLAPTIPAPIFVDDKEKIVAETPAETLAAIRTSLSRPPASGTARLLYSDISTTTGNTIFDALDLPAPGSLLRNIDAPRSMVGIISTAGTSSPFFILTVTSYSDTFAGLLSWETTMPNDLSELFPPYQVAAAIPTFTASTTTATTTTATTTKTATQKPKKGTTAKQATTTPPAPPPPPPSFHDEVVDNHDVRVYRDSSSNSILIYGYWNKNTLVIARDPGAFAELLRRLATTQ